MISQPTTELPPPIYTRYQLRGCIKKVDGVCSERMEAIELIHRYTYRWNPRGPYAPLNEASLWASLARQFGDDGDDDDASSSSTPLRKKKKWRWQQQQPSVRLCFVGASHSRQLNEFCTLVLNYTDYHSPDDYLLQEVIGCAHIRYSYPVNIIARSADELRSVFHSRNCTHAIVGLYQWYFSAQNSKKGPLRLSERKDEMTEATRVLSEMAADCNDSNPFCLRKIILRSAHPNGMGWRHSKCPAKDFRSLPNTIKATSVLQEIAADFAANNNTMVSFIDTNPIIDPVWDSNRDWSHYRWEAGEVEFKFLLWNILLEEWG